MLATTIKVVGEAPFTVDFVVRASNPGGDVKHPTASSGDGTTARPFVAPATVSGWLEAGSRSFSEQFRERFSLEDKGFEERDVAAAKAALSNMLGGMGYFTGRSEMRGAGRDGGNEVSFETSLFTAVPSRSFFPRGFLWDEGFHQVSECIPEECGTGRLGICSIQVRHESGKCAFGLSRPM